MVVRMSGHEIIGSGVGVVRPGGDQLNILEQTIHDSLLSISFQIHKADFKNAGYAYFIRLLGAIPLGTRTLYFAEDGQFLYSRTESDIGKINKALTGGDVPR